jgi:membrane-bound serine protease (ClpP class)
MMNFRPIAKFAARLAVTIRLTPAVSSALLVLTLAIPAAAADSAPAPLSPDYFGAVLLLIGVALLVAEAHVGAFGVIGAWGVAAFIIGVLTVFPALAPGIVLPHLVVTGAAVGGAVLLLLALAVLLRSRKKPVVTGNEALIGAAGETVSWQDGEGRVRVNGEIWRARADRPLAAGTQVKVIGRDGLVLHVGLI